mgnify:CR=1 FL=1
MLKVRVILGVVAVLLIFGMYQMPRIVVENDVINDAQQLSQPEDLNEESPEGHSTTVDAEQAKIIASLREKLDVERNPKNFVNFADSLGRLYVKASNFDSAFYYSQKILEADPGKEGQLTSGLLVYRIFEVTNDPKKAQALGLRVRNLLEPIYEETKEESLKIKLGMTYVVTSNPMQGILMIREVLEENPQNTEALFQLGLLAVQSGQTEKAIERFEAVLKITPNDWNSVLYLGISHAELGQVDMAKKYFDRIMEDSNDPVLLQIASNYLKGIN